jgi:hypothetical protein
MFADGLGDQGGESMTPMTEVEWLRRRRAQVSSVARGPGAQAGHLDPAAASRAAAVAVATAAGLWTQRHASEALLQDKRLELRLAENVTTLLPHETSPLVTAHSNAMDEARRAGFQKRERAEAVLAVKFVRPPSGNFAGCLIHVARDLPPLSPEVFQRLHARPARDPTTATTFVVRDPARAGRLPTLAAALCGGRLCTMEYVLSGGAAGCALAYHNASVVPRMVWASRRFQQQSPETFKVIMAVPTWKIITTCSEFVRRSQARATQKRYVGLVTPEDKLAALQVHSLNWNLLCHSVEPVTLCAPTCARALSARFPGLGPQVFAALGNVYTGSEFVKWLARADAERSALGLGGA